LITISLVSVNIVKAARKIPQLQSFDNFKTWFNAVDKKVIFLNLVPAILFAIVLMAIVLIFLLPYAFYLALKFDG
jgi:ABC-type maltose transport system permease subunit